MAGQLSLNCKEGCLGPCTMEGHGTLSPDLSSPGIGWAPALWMSSGEALWGGSAHTRGPSGQGLWFLVPGEFQHRPGVLPAGQQAETLKTLILHPQSSPPRQGPLSPHVCPDSKGPSFHLSPYLGLCLCPPHLPSCPFSWHQ